MTRVLTLLQVLLDRKLLLMQQFDDVAELFDTGRSEWIKYDNEMMDSYTGKAL